VTVGAPWVAALTREVLKGKGSLSWSLVLEASVPAEVMRELCREHGLSPKGGFRLEKAGPRVLAPLLAEQRDPKLIESLVEALRAALQDVGDEPSPRREDPVPPPTAVDPEGWKARFEHARAELQRREKQLERERTAGARHRQRAEQLARRLDQYEEREVMLQREIARLRRELAEASAPPVAPGRDDAARQRELERDLEALEVAEAGLRRRLAVARTRERELEEQVGELEALVPKGRRRRRRVEEPPQPAKRFVVPYLLPAFYKSLDGKERRSVERAVQALLLYATEGPAYPGLEVKQLGGQDTWSMRASLKLRIYFRPRDDGDIDVLALADREDQATMLRRLKET